MSTKKPQAEADTTAEVEEQLGEIQEEEQEIPKEWEKIVPDACYRSVDEVYEFERILGSGAFSDVVLGRHNETQTEYAIKIIEKAKVCDTEQRKKRVLMEIGILRQCEHENILKIHEIYETALDISLVLDLMHGGELFDLIVQEGRLSEKDARRLAKQMLSALDYLHDNGICHRDLKPENMLCTSKDAATTDVRITDFGLAKFGKDCLETPCGTVSYVAPEIVANELYDNSVDLWALGCVLYFMLFGKPPFYGDDEEEIMDLVEEGTYTFPVNVHISDAAKDFLSHLLEKDPSARYTTKQALRHKWLLTGEGEDSKKLPAEEAPGAEKGGSGQLNLSKEKRDNLKSSVNRAIDVQRDGVFLKPAAECTIAMRRGVAGKPLKLDLDFEF